LLFRAGRRDTRGAVARVLYVLVAVALAGCGDDLHQAPPPPDGPSTEITGIDLSPLVLTPPFSPSIHDYAVRCAEGPNPATLTVTDGRGAEASAVELVEDQLLAVRDQYFIRCLPHDFPAMSTTLYPDAGAPTEGYYLINSATFAIALDTQGTPVWYRRSTRMIDLDAPQPNVLSFKTDAAPWVELNLADGTETHVSAVGTPADEHELRRLPNGDHVLIAYPSRAHVDLTGLRTFGADETVADCEIQVVDPAGDLVWSWLATDHVDPVTESVSPSSVRIDGVVAVDLYHCNSVDVDAAGNFVLSMRWADTVVYIDRATGTIEWKLGGTPSSKDGAPYIAVVADPQEAFRSQHDARLSSAGRITVYDNHVGDVDGVARGVEYTLDLATHEATFVRQLLGVAKSRHEGSFRVQADGHSVISWGGVPGETRAVTEYDEAGDVVLDVSMPGEVSYRAVKVPTSQLDITLLRQTAGP
jgi:hypothetical protein